MNLTIPEFAMLLLVSSGLAVILFHGASRVFQAHGEARALRRRVVCRICFHAYVDPATTPGKHPTECPNCGTANDGRT